MFLSCVTFIVQQLGMYIWSAFVSTEDVRHLKKLVAYLLSPLYPVLMIDLHVRIVTYLFNEGIGFKVSLVFYKKVTLLFNEGMGF
jgi:hypothetical protein